MRKRIIVGVSVLAVLGWAAVYAMRSGKSGIEVDTVKVSRVEALQSFVTASGEIVATKYADIGSAVMGRLVELKVKEGESVKAGQVLARIDPVQASSSADAAAASVGALEADARAAATQVRAAQASLEEARSREKEAAASWIRAQELQRAGLLPQSEFDKASMAGTTSAAQVAAATAAFERAQQAQASAERRIAQGQAERTRARDALSKTEITAPIDGVITRLEVEQGEMVVMGVQNQPGTILMTVSDLSSVNAEVKVAEADVMRLSNNFPATVTLARSRKRCVFLLSTVPRISAAWAVAAKRQAAVTATARLEKTRQRLRRKTGVLMAREG